MNEREPTGLTVVRIKTMRDPRLAASLKRSAERSSRRKACVYRSALSMLTFLHQSRREDIAQDPAATA
jgi:Protein of unknown function (DUF3175)